MLRFKSRQIFLAGILILSFSGIALADTVQGKVVGVNSNAVDVVVYDAQGGPYSNALHLKTGNFTQYHGVSSGARLRKNDAVEVQVSQESSGAWRADEINRLGSEEPIQTTTSPSPSLAGALGNPIVRNALLGAATGAIASKASGGKAGKGALVGAGVGIAGGLLGDLLGGGSRSQSSDADVSYQEDARN